jgi:hypothetical protein
MKKELYQMLLDQCYGRAIILSGQVTSLLQIIYLCHF